MIRSVLSWLNSAFRHNSLRARRARAWAEVVEQIIPSRPQVGAHQRSALKHAQLAEEINWTGPRGAGR